MLHPRAEVEELFVAWHVDPTLLQHPELNAKFVRLRSTIVLFDFVGASVECLFCVDAGSRENPFDAGLPNSQVNVPEPLVARVQLSETTEGKGS